MTDSLERLLRDLRFDVPAGLTVRAKAAAAVEAAAVRQAMRATTHHKRGFAAKRNEWALTMVALLLALAIVVTLVFTAQRLRPKASVPGAPLVRTTAPIQIGAPGVGVCRTLCSLESAAPLFVSGTVGWLTEFVGRDHNPCNPVCPSTVLFRTDDGGSQWKAQLSWKGLAHQILASPDGMEVLVVSAEGDHTELFHSSDGGAHWTSSGFPPGAGSLEIGSALNPQWYFLNPQEGWVLVQGSYSIAELFHTTDSGGHWSRIPIDIKAEFNLNLGPANSGLDGYLVFRDSSTGWFIPTPGWDMYLTHDGGRTWHVQSLSMPSRIQPGLISSIEPMRLFSNERDGVLKVIVFMPGQGTVPKPQSYPVEYVYTTLDGGDHWSNPTSLPNVAIPPGGAPATLMFSEMNIDFIDATHWVASPEFVGGLMRTSDAGQHWDFMPASSDGGSGQFPGPWFGFVDPSRGWAIYQPPTGSTASGVVLYGTTDGGASWTPLSLPGLS